MTTTTTGPEFIHQACQGCPTPKGGGTLGTFGGMCARLQQYFLEPRRSYEIRQNPLPTDSAGSRWIREPCIG